MNKYIIIAASGVVVLSGAALLVLGSGSQEAPQVSGSSCSAACAQAHETCPSLIDTSTCDSACEKLSNEAREHLQTADSCEALTARPDLLADILVPEVEGANEYTDKATGSQDCEAACGHYVSACLTYVPSATEALYEEGYNSCLNECANWNAGKVDCMISAFDCEAMTNVCGL